MTKYLLPALVGALCLISFGATAEEEKQSEPAKNEVVAAAEEFTKDLDEPSKRHFGVLYGNYNLIKVVESVRDSVDEAVDKCGDENPDIKEKLETRFDAWKDAVKPVMKDADANVNNMVFAQEYAKPRELKNFFKLIDKARKQQDKDVKKVPVTTPEACQSLLEKMDETQPNMIKLLQATLVSLPKAMQQADQEARQKAEAEAKAKEEAEAKKKAEEDAKKEADQEDL